MIILKPATVHHLSQFPPTIDTTWSTDTNTAMKSVVRGKTWLSAAMQDWYISMPTNPNVELVVAVEGDSDEVVGWCAWGFRNFEDKELEMLRTWDDVDRTVKLSSRRDEGKRSTIVMKDMPQTPQMTEAEIKTGKERIDAMEEMTSADLASWEAKHIPPATKALLIYSITVSSTHQGLGIGSALIHWGMRRADRANTWAWVHGSESAKPLFQKEKWEVVGRKEVDLDEWDPRPEGKRVGRWGQYCFTYFRWPTVREREGRIEKPVFET